MEKERKTLDVEFILKEDIFVFVRIALPLLTSLIGIIMTATSNGGENMVLFLVGTTVAFFSILYLVYFLISRMIFVFRSRNIAQNQINIIREQSHKQLGFGFIIFCMIVFILFGTAIFFGTEQGPFQYLLSALDLAILAALCYSIWVKKKK